MTTLGSLLYGLKPATVTASGIDPELYAIMTGMSFDHQACELEVFCRNPLHPGPCKGWKKTLGHIAPGALTAIEKAQKEKTAARRVARAAAKAEAEKKVATGPAHVLSHPLTAKKATIEHANVLLGNAPHKAQSKAAKTILNKQEIKKYSQLKAAQIAGIAGDHGLNSNPEKYKTYLEGAIAGALAKDNVDGGDKNYRHFLGTISESLASGLADRYCGVGSKDGDCDGLLYEALHAHAGSTLEHALVTGNPDELNKLEADLKKIGDDRAAMQKYLTDHGVDLEKIKANLYEPDQVATPEPKPEPVAPSVKPKVAESGKSKTAEVVADQAAKAPEPPKPAAVTDPDNPIAKALATGVNADVVKALSDHPDAWDGLSPALKEVVGQKVYTENIVGDDITKVITADLIDKHAIPHPVTGKVGGQLPEGHPTKAPAEPEDPFMQHPFGQGPPSYEMKTAVSVLSDPKSSNEEKINALSDLEKSEYDSLLPAEKAKAEAAIKEGVAGGDPLAKQLATQHGVGATEQIGPGAVKLNPTQQHASDLASGVKSGTAKQQIAAFDKLTQEEFGQLSPTTQKLIMAKLTKAKDKFLDPKKKAHTQGIIDYLSPAMGGGAGAGGTGGHVAPNLSAATPLTDEEKGQKVADFVQEAFQVLGKPMAPEGINATATVLTSMHANGAKSDPAFEQLAGSYADQLLKQANLGLPDAALANFADPLKADILEKVKATGAPTPVYDAWKAATLAKGTVAAHSALMALDSASLDWHAKHGGANGGDFLGNLLDSVPTADDVQKKADSFSEVYDKLYEAAAGKAPSTPDQQLTKIHGLLSKDGLTALTSHHPVAEDLGTNLATAHLAKVIMGLHLPTKYTDELHTQGVFKPLKSALIGDYAEALSVENSAGGVAAKLDGILEDVNKATDDVVSKNGWAKDSVAALQFKKALFASKVQDALKGVAPAGAGGKATAPTPAAGVASSLPPVDLSGGTDISHLSEEAKLKILGSFKGLPAAQLKDPPEKVFKNLVAVAAASSKDPSIGPVSLTQVMKAVDVKHAQNMGVTNAGLLEKKIKDWLATPAGWDFAQNNAKPDPKLYSTLTGTVTLPSGKTLEPGQKVQPVGGPGGFDHSKTSADFPVVQSHKAIADQQAYWNKTGFKLSDDQIAAIKSYTLGSGPMNFWLRGEDSTGKPYLHASAVTQQHIIDLQDAMHPLQYDMSLHRGTGWEFAPKGYRSPGEFKKLIGKTLDDPAFMSSSNGGTAAFSSEPVIIHFEAPAGTMALQVDPWSEFHGAENEMLLAAGTKYKVLSVDDSKPNQTIVKVRIVS